jgi:integrase
MAGISQTPQNTYRVQIRRAGIPPIYKSFKTKEEAMLWARQKELEIDTGFYINRKEAEKITIGSLIDRYINEVSIHKKGYKQERPRLKKLQREIGHYYLTKLQSKDIARFRDSRLKAGLAPSSVLNEISLISQLFEMAIKEWSIPIEINPCKNIRKPKVNNQRNRVLEGDEEERLLAYSKLSRSELLPHMIQLAIETAMRCSELLSLTWNNINLEKRTAYLATTKNGDSRTVPLSSKAIEVLNSMPRHPKSNRVFWTWTQKDSVVNTWKRVCRKAGITNLHFHDLRHEATTRLANKLPNILELSAVTGHKDLRMLKRYYHPKAEELALKLG